MRCIYFMPRKRLLCREIGRPVHVMWNAHNYVVTCSIYVDGDPIYDNEGNIIGCENGDRLGDAPVTNNQKKYENPILCD